MSSALTANTPSWTAIRTGTALTQLQILSADNNITPVSSDPTTHTCRTRDHPCKMLSLDSVLAVYAYQQHYESVGYRAIEFCNPHTFKLGTVICNMGCFVTGKKT